MAEFFRTRFGCPIRLSRQVWCICACLCLHLGSAADAAKPGLHPDVFYGPLAQFFEGDKRYVTLREAGRPSMYIPLSMPWYDSEVEVDSVGVKYIRHLAGRSLDPPVRLGRSAHLKAAYKHKVGEEWYKKVRRDFRTKAVASQRTGNRRLHWNVPFHTSSRTLRRIIGTEGPSLSISGSHKTTISGKSNWTSGEVRTISSRPSKFPTLGMDQESRFTVEGKVGELINIRISQDTQNVGLGLQDALANQIKIDYKSDDEDAIIQEIQAGNTTLELPGTRFVSFRQQLKGLFGFRTKGNVGPMSFTAIASHEKSKGNRRSLSGGAVADTVTLRDHQYMRNKVFFLDEFYRVNLTDFRQVARRPEIAAEDFVDFSFLQVFVNDFNTNNDQEKRAREGVAVVFEADSLARAQNVAPGTPVFPAQIRDESGWIERGTWHQLDPDNDYALLDGGGYISLRQPIQDRHALAVSYRTAGGMQVGSAQGDTLQLKLIKARDARPEFPTWDLEWKNVYRITNSGFGQGKKFDRSSIDVQILKEVAGQEPLTSQDGTSYLQIMGLDEHGQSLTDPPDRLIDATYPGLDELEGLLIFPDQTPFAPQDPKFQKLKDPVEVIYTSAQQRDHAEASTYIIRAVTSSGQAKIRLPFGVNPTSVEVRLNGQSLEFGRDFNVGFSGDLTFISDQASRAAADPGADIDITFETEDLFGGGQQKTLLGLRSDYEFWDGDGRIGGTLLYNNERSSERRIRVGNEPARTVVWDMDLRTEFEAPLLTRVVDAMPLLKTAAPSDITLKAEVAQSRPNLNTKGKGFIDDFEGSEQPTLLSIIRTRWTPASQPLGLDFAAENRSRMIWYNPFNKISRLEIWPNEEEQLDVSNNRTDILVLELEPEAGAIDAWNGVMTPFSSVNDFSRSKFLEIWLRGEEGFLHLDLGDLSEDLDGDGFLDTEDEPIGGLSSGNGVVDEDEDVGLDGRTSAEELDYYLGLAVQSGDLAEVDTVGLDIDGKKQLFAGVYPNRNAEDPEGDDWAFSDRRRDDFTRINGTEGNGPESNNQRPDTEDLNNDGFVNQRNDYYHYTIDLALDPHVAGTRSPAGWRLFRLPLYENIERHGNPDSTRIEFARLSVTNPMAADGEETVIEIAQMEVVGNQWQEDEVVALGDAFPPSEDEGLDVTTVGTRENEGYKPPPGVKLKRSSASRRRESEQSLVLAYTNLDVGHQMSASRILTSEQNYTKYTRLRMYAHGDSLGDYLARQDSSTLQLFLRFGRDSTNYYEFTTHIFPGWDGLRAGWSGNEVDIDLELMAQLKSVLQQQLPDSTGQRSDRLDTVIVRPRLRDGESAIYSVRGSPSMQQIKQLTIGLRNLGETQLDSGQVWLDELRLEDVRNDAGLAAFANLNTQLADFANVQTEIKWEAENFRTLTSTDRNSSDLQTKLGTNTNVHQFFPGRWGLNMPLKVSTERTLNLPRFGPNADVKLTKKEKDAARSLFTKQFFEFSFSKRGGRNWFWRWTLDQMSLRTSYTLNRRSTPTIPLENQDIRTLSYSYKMPLPKKDLLVLKWLPEFMPKGMRQARLRYLPSSLAYSMNANQQEKKSLRVSDADTTFQETFTLKETYSGNVAPLAGLQGDLSLKLDRDLRKKYAPRDLSFGREVGRDQKGRVKYSLRFIKWLDQNYEFQAQYTEDNNPTQRLTQVVVDSTTGAPIPTRDINTKNNVSARFGFKLPALLRDIGKPSGPKKGGSEEGTFFVWRLFHWTSSRVDNVNAKWQQDTTTRNFNLTRRPSLSYQLGLDDSLKVERAVVGLTQQDQWSRRDDWSGDSGLKLPLGFGIKTKYGEVVTRRTGSNQNRIRVEERITFPGMSISWNQAHRMPLIKRVLQSSNATVNYETTKTRGGEVLRRSEALKINNLINREEGSDLRVSWSGKAIIGPVLNITREMNNSTSLDFETVASSDSSQVGEVERPLRGSSTFKKRKTQITTRYSMRPRSLPIFGKLKSIVNFNFKFSTESELRESATVDAEREPVADTSKWDFEIKGDYKFSSLFTGQGLFRIEKNHNNITEKTRNAVEVQVLGTMSFR